MKWLRIVFIFLLVSLCIGLRGITDAKAKSGIRLKKKAKGGGSRGGSKPIKLSGKKKKGAASRGGLASVQGRRKAPPPPSEPTREQIEEMTMQPDEPKAPPPPDTDEAVVSILDPPNKSTIAGSSFDLRVQIDPVNSEVFMESYNNSNSRVCVSLDGSPYSCWPVFGGKIRYINAVDGPHSIHAVLMKKGVIIPESITESVQFTTVESPEIEDENEEESSALEEEGEDGESKRVQLSMPQLILQVPPEKVTLPGSAVQLVSRVDLAGGDIEVFEEHFKHQFVCYNVDATTAHACWSLLDESTVPFVTQVRASESQRTVHVTVSRSSNEWSSVI